MSLENSYPRCAVEIGPSRSLFACFLLLTVFALAAPWAAGLDVVPALFIGLAALASAPPLFRYARGELSHIVWMPNGEWKLVDAEGREHGARAVGEGVLVTRAFVGLRWRCECCRAWHRTALVHDNCEADAFRRILVRLRATPDDELFGRTDQFESGSGQ